MPPERLVTTVALRFRDLAGSTIPDHRALIAAHGTVWWAWRSKPEERIPREFLSQLVAGIERGEETWLFLADSGRKQTYRAKLSDVRVAPGHQPIPSPEQLRTPGYYRDKSYLVWFEFAAIEDPAEDDPADQITNYSYDELPQGAFDSDPHREDFNNKRVFSIQELLSRHRTMYFLRPAQDSDDGHLVTLGASERPGPFLAATREVPSDYVLHLSDVHYGGHHAFPRRTDGPQRNLAIRVIDDLRGRYGEKPPAAVILSGDFTWLGSEEEFGLAGELIEELQSVFRLHSSRFVI